MTTSIVRLIAVQISQMMSLFYVYEYKFNDSRVRVTAAPAADSNLTHISWETIVFILASIYSSSYTHSFIKQ